MSSVSQTNTAMSCNFRGVKFSRDKFLIKINFKFIMFDSAHTDKNLINKDYYKINSADLLSYFNPISAAKTGLIEHKENRYALSCFYFRRQSHAHRGH